MELRAEVKELNTKVDKAVQELNAKMDRVLKAVEPRRPA
eukprot:COSAG01_NODE_944_length_12547_cov_7.354515_2_plen_39_part_00